MTTAEDDPRVAVFRDLLARLDAHRNRTDHMGRYEEAGRLLEDVAGLMAAAGVPELVAHRAGAEAAEAVAGEGAVDMDDPANADRDLPRSDQPGARGRAFRAALARILYDFRGTLPRSLYGPVIQDLIQRNEGRRFGILDGGRMGEGRRDLFPERHAKNLFVRMAIFEAARSGGRGGWLGAAAKAADAMGEAISDDTLRHWKKDVPQPEREAAKALGLKVARHAPLMPEERALFEALTRHPLADVLRAVRERPWAARG